MKKYEDVMADALTRIKDMRRERPWPTDPVYGASLVVEEVGELVQAVNDMVDSRLALAERDNLVRAYQECLDVLVTACTLAVALQYEEAYLRGEQ